MPADGFYEWLRDGWRAPAVLPPRGAACPADGPGLLAMAGLWSLWKDPATGQWIPSCAVVTTTASEQVAPIHDRMPVILPRDAWWPWLDPAETDPAYLRSLLVPAADDALDLYPVSSRVNSVRNNGPDLIVRVEPAAAAVTQGTLFGLGAVRGERRGECAAGPVRRSPSPLLRPGPCGALTALSGLGRPAATRRPPSRLGVVGVGPELGR